MKQSLLLIWLLLSTHLVAASQSYAVLDIEDGDTLILEVDGQPVRVQLLGIDAPEDTDNPKLHRDLQRTGLEASQLLELGHRATRHLRGLAPPGTTVSLIGDITQRDKYGRLPAILMPHDGPSLNTAMVEDGYAIPLSAYPLDDTLEKRLVELESEAINNRRGLWQDDLATTMTAWSGGRGTP
ncbi:MAG: thermonuclease family protein [Gammaproteobacteria bacterium]|nr:thermonuclease family protein [Gammaproteobacteria bacterium]